MTPKQLRAGAAKEKKEARQSAKEQKAGNAKRLKEDLQSARYAKRERDKSVATWLRHEFWDIDANLTHALSSVKASKRKTKTS